MEHLLDICIDQPFEIQIREDWLRRVVEEVLGVEWSGEACELGLVITDDEAVRRLNRDYRDIDATTDVLAFAMQEDLEGSEFPELPGTATQLGEVIVSYPQAARQAEELGHSAQHEVAALVIHGVLHLFGYDHATDEEKVAMKARETEILSRLKA